MEPKGSSFSQAWMILLRFGSRISAASAETMYSWVSCLALLVSDISDPPFERGGAQMLNLRNEFRFPSTSPCSAEDEPLVARGKTGNRCVEGSPMRITT